MEAGQVVVRGRGSRTGCVVNGTAVGGQALRDSETLAAGDNELALAGAESPYRFSLRVARA